MNSIKPTTLPTMRSCDPVNFWSSSVSDSQSDLSPSLRAGQPRSAGIYLPGAKLFVMLSIVLRQIEIGWPLPVPISSCRPCWFNSVSCSCFARASRSLRDTMVAMLVSYNETTTLRSLTSTKTLPAITKYCLTWIPKARTTTTTRRRRRRYRA